MNYTFYLEYYRILKFQHKYLISSYIRVDFHVSLKSNMNNLRRTAHKNVKNLYKYPEMNKCMLKKCR